MTIKVELRSKGKRIVQPIWERDRELRVKVRLLIAARPADVNRIAQLLGGDVEFAAYTIATADCDVDTLVAQLEEAMLRLAGELMDDAKKRTPIDTGVLRAAARKR